MNTIFSSLLLFFYSLSALSASDQLLKDYLRQRDQYILQFEKTKEVDDVADRKALKELEVLMRKMIGPVKLANFTGEGAINLSTLQNEMGFGQLDGMSYRSGGEAWIITTWPLLNSFLSAKPRLPKDLAGLATTEKFHFSLFLVDAATSVFSEISVKAPKGVNQAFAVLTMSHQAIGPFVPNEITILASKGDWVMIGKFESKMKSEKINACTSIWDEFEKKASAIKDSKESSRIEDDGFEAYKKCYGNKIKDQKAYAVMKKEAQDILDKMKE